MYPQSPFPGYRNATFGQPQPYVYQPFPPLSGYQPYPPLYGSESTVDQCNSKSEAFKFFEQHKESLQPIQNMFNQFTGSNYQPNTDFRFSSMFGPQVGESRNRESGVASTLSTWVQQVEPAGDLSLGIDSVFTFQVASSTGDISTHKGTLREFAQATSNNGVLNTLLNRVAMSPKPIDGHIWKFKDTYIISIKGVGSFVADTNMKPLLTRFHQPIVDLTPPVKLPELSTDEILVVTNLWPVQDSDAWNVEYQKVNVKRNRVVTLLVEQLDLGEVLKHIEGLTPLAVDAKEARVGWMLPDGRVLTLGTYRNQPFNEVLDADGVKKLTNLSLNANYSEQILQKHWGKHTDKRSSEELKQETEQRIAKNMQKASVEPIKVYRSIDGGELTTERFTCWLSSTFSIDNVDREKEGELRFHMVNRTTRCILAVEDDWLSKWFDLQSPTMVNGHDLNKIVRLMRQDANLVATIVTFERLNAAIIQVIPTTPDQHIELYVADMKRATSFAEATKELNSRWLNVE